MHRGFNRARAMRVQEGGHPRPCCRTELWVGDRTTLTSRVSAYKEQAKLTSGASNWGSCHQPLATEMGYDANQSVWAQNNPNIIFTEVFPSASIRCTDNWVISRALLL